MGHVADILEGKGREVLAIDGAATVYDAIVKMVDGNVGALLVNEGDRLAGIVTERDYLRRVTLQGRDERTTPVREIMTSELVYVGPDASIDECMAVMTERRIRHLPVLSEGREVLGIVSIGDVVKFQEHAHVGNRVGAGEDDDQLVEVRDQEVLLPRAAVAGLAPREAGPPGSDFFDHALADAIPTLSGVRVTWSPGTTRSSDRRSRFRRPRSWHSYVPDSVVTV